MNVMPQWNRGLVRTTDWQKGQSKKCDSSSDVVSPQLSCHNRRTGLAVTVVVDVPCLTQKVTIRLIRWMGTEG